MDSIRVVIEKEPLGPRVHSSVADYLEKLAAANEILGRCEVCKRAHQRIHMVRNLQDSKWARSDFLWTCRRCAQWVSRKLVIEEEKRRRNGY